MKLNDSTSWLSAKGCKDGDIVKFLDEGSWIDSTKYTYEDGNPVRQLVFKVEHEGEEKKMGIIKPSREAMIEAYGDDTSEWIGIEATIALVLNTKGSKSIVLSPKSERKILSKEEAEVNLDQDGEEEIPF